MNSRSLLVFAVLIAAVVGLLAGEGGPIDRLADGDGAAPAGETVAAAPAPDRTPVGAADFFSLQDEEPAELDFGEDGADGADDFGFAPKPQRSTPRPTLGALSKEQLNVEEPVGLASMREPVLGDT